MWCDLADQALFGHEADNALDWLAALEHDKGRYAHHAIGHRRAGALIHIEFGDLELAVVLGGDLVEHRSDHLAGAAPLRPEIGDDDIFTVENLVLKILIGYGKWG